MFGLIVEKLGNLFEPHCSISAYTQDYKLKLSIQINFNTLISDLKSYIKIQFTGALLTQKCLHYMAKAINKNLKKPTNIKKCIN